jgi:arylsulfatase A-like enzyme
MRLKPEGVSALSRRAFLGMASAALAAPAKRPPNFIILFADDMGYSDLACFGHPTIRTPNLDRMAEQGIRLTSFYCAAPVCTPSRAGLLTGRYPVRAGQPNNLGPDSKGGLPLTEILLPQVLKQRGYRTAMIGKWHLGHDPEDHMPTRRGFDSYFGLLYSNDMIPPWVQTKRPLELYRDTKPVERLEDQSTLTQRYTEEAVRVIRAAGSQPFLLYLAYAMPHLPVSASGKFLGSSRAGLYGDVIETLDWSAGEILKTLRAQGIDEHTLVVFTSDNGPWHNLPPRMLQKGVEPWHTGTKGLLRGAKGTTYEGGQRVPFIARWPGVIPPRQVSADMASTLDLFPTLVKAAGGKLPGDRVYDGFDILPFLQGKEPSPRRSFFYFSGKTLEAFREGSWKCRYSRAGRTDVKAGEPFPPELFNVDVDPAEAYDVYGRHKEIADRMLQRMREFAAELKAAMAS